MQYRKLGRTGLQVSEIGLGCEGFVLKDDAFAGEIFRTALESGVNCMDLYTPNPGVHRRVGRAIQGRREAFVLQAHLCTIWENGQYRATRDPEEVRASFETMLKNLGTDYIDVGMIHYVDSVSEWEKIANGPRDAVCESAEGGRAYPLFGREQPQPGGSPGRSGEREHRRADVQRQPVLRPAARR